MRYARGVNSLDPNFRFPSEVKMLRRRKGPPMRHTIQKHSRMRMRPVCYEDR